jgi:hypothetical protein
LTCVVFALAGCASKQAGPTTRPATAAERTDRAERDPFHYSLDWSEADVSGGDTANLDREGLKRDLGNVIMP